MEEINLKDLFNYYLEKILYVIIATSVMLVIGFIYGAFIQKPVYESSTSLILTGFSSNTEGETGINTNDLSINQKLLPTYQQITKSRKVLNQVIDELDLDYNVDELGQQITVSSVADTEIIKITVKAEDKKEAYKIVTKIAQVFSEEVKTLYDVSNVSVLDEAEIPKNTSNTSVFKIMIISAFVGFVLSCAIIFVVFYFDTTIKTVEQIEQRFDIPILGSVPDYNKTSKKNRKGK